MLNIFKAFLADLDEYFYSNLINTTSNHIYKYRLDELFEVLMWPLNLPLSCSDTMNGITNLYLNVMSINMSIFLAVLWMIIEALVSSTTTSIKTSIGGRLTAYYRKNKPKVMAVYNYPLHFQTWEEHIIDIFAIILPTLIVLNQIVPTLGYLYNEEFQFYDKTLSFEVNIIGNQWFWSAPFNWINRSACECTHLVIVDVKDIDLSDVEKLGECSMSIKLSEIETSRSINLSNLTLLRFSWENYLSYTLLLYLMKNSIMSQILKEVQTFSMITWTR